MHGSGSYVTANGKTFSGKWKNNNLIEPKKQKPCKGEPASLSPNNNEKSQF